MKKEKKVNKKGDVISGFELCGNPIGGKWLVIEAECSGPGYSLNDHDWYPGPHHMSLLRLNSDDTVPVEIAGENILIVTQAAVCYANCIKYCKPDFKVKDEPND